jgi:hypothetical protein
MYFSCGEGFMVDGIIMAGVCVEKITWQDRKQEGYRGQAQSF